MIVIVIHSEIICGAPASINPASSSIKPWQTVADGQRGYRIHKRGRAARPVHAEVDVVLRAPARATTAPEVHERQAAGAKIVNQPEIHRIAATASRSDEMKVLRGAIQTGQRNESEQRFRRRADERRIDYVELPIALKLLPRCRIEDLHRAAVFIRGSGKIA